MPAASPLSGENASPESTRAQTSSRAVAAARMDRSMLVFPEDGRPKISLIAPRGRLPVVASNAAIPVETVSRTRLSRSVKGVDIRPPRTVSNWARRDIVQNRDGHRYTVHLYGSQWEGDHRPSPQCSCRRALRTRTMYMPKKTQQTAAPLIPPQPTI